MANNSDNGPRSYREFDHNQRGLSVDAWFSGYARLRAECPIGKSDQYGGYWVVTGYPEASTIIHDPGTFSSRVVTIPAHPQAAPMIPEEIDPPRHRDYRSILTGPFSAKTVLDQHSGPVRRAVGALIDEFVESGRCEAFEAIAVPLPVFVLMRLLGLPESDAEMLRDWVERIVHGSASNPESAVAAVAEQYTYFTNRLAELRAGDGTGDDVLSVLLRAAPNGSPLSQEELLGFCLTLLVAGVDTTQKFIGSVIWQLAADAGLRRRLAADPGLLPDAIEELLRYWAPVQLGRVVTEDTEIAGARLKAGDSVMVLVGAANRDERVFPRPEEFRLDRSPNRHFGFGAHIHRCVGAHIVRLELHILLAELLRRLPEFELDPEVPAEWLPSQVQGMVRVPIRFPPGRREA